MKDGRRYHHLLDPATGQPARGCRSVTIVADSRAARRRPVHGRLHPRPGEGMALVERLPQVEG